jgi:hypothetical protein
MTGGERLVALSLWVYYNENQIQGCEYTEKEKKIWISIMFIRQIKDAMRRWYIIG